MHRHEASLSSAVYSVELQNKNTKSSLGCVKLKLTASTSGGQVTQSNQVDRKVQNLRETGEDQKATIRMYDHEPQHHICQICIARISCILLKREQNGPKDND